MQKDKGKKIRDFLQGKLSNDDLNEFKKDVHTGDDLLNELSIEVVKEYERNQLKQKLNKFHNEVSVQQVITMNLFLKIAAIVIIITGLVIAIFNMPERRSSLTRENLAKNDTTSTSMPNVKKKDTVIKNQTKPLPNKKKDNLMSEFPKEINKNNKELFIDYYEPFLTTVYRNDHDHLSEAKRLYDQKEYKKAYEYFQKTLITMKSEEKMNEALFYSGLCILADTVGSKEKLDEAADCFNAVYSNKKYSLQDKAAWYLALFYVKENDQKKAKEILNKIIAKKSFQYKKAVLLLKELND